MYTSTCMPFSTDSEITSIQELTKGQCLDNSLQGTALDHVKTIILSDSGLRENFFACVNLFQDFITQKEAESPNVMIAAVSNNQSQPQHPEETKPRYKKNNNNKAGGQGAGIKTATLDHVKTRILSDAGLREFLSLCQPLPGLHHPERDRKSKRLQL